MNIKEEDPLLDNIESQNETEQFTMTTNSDAIKTEIKSETPFDKAFIKQIEFETATCSNNWEKTEIEKQNRVMKSWKLNAEDEIDKKIQIKVEPLYLETSSVCDDIKDVHFPPVTSSRLYTEAVSDASPFPSAERHTSFYNGKDHLECERQESDVTEMSTAEQSSDGGYMYIGSLYLKTKNFIKGKRPHKCNICAREFSYLSQLKTHNLIHEGKKPHQCKICKKSFKRFSHLKTHNLTHEGKKPHECQICHKSFTRLTDLRRHYLIHEGKKLHQCKTCDKSFTFLSDLKRHCLIHEGKKPHQCKTCGKSFTRRTHLKTHHFVHEDKKPHPCKTCDKSFAQMSDLRTHNMIHEGKKPHKCKTCDKSFTRLSHLKTHSFVHDGKKEHQCEICNSGFARLGDLNTHNLIHEGKK